MSTRHTLSSRPLIETLNLSVQPRSCLLTGMLFTCRLHAVAQDHTSVGVDISVLESRPGLWVNVRVLRGWGGKENDKSGQGDGQKLQRTKREFVRVRHGDVSDEKVGDEKKVGDEIQHHVNEETAEPPIIEASDPPFERQDHLLHSTPVILSNVDDTRPRRCDDHWLLHNHCALNDPRS
jgi:hypothetical protein